MKYSCHYLLDGVELLQDLYFQMVLYRGFTQIIEVRTRTNLSSNRWPRARDYILFYEDILRQLIYLRCVDGI